MVAHPFHLSDKVSVPTPDLTLRIDLLSTGPATF